MRIAYVLSFLFFLLGGTTAFAGDRLNLPQKSAEVSLNTNEVKSIFGLQPEKNLEPLPARVSQVLIDSLPEDFRKGCHDMVVDFGPATAPKTSWTWSVRLLHSENGQSGQSALLAFRCTVHVPDLTYIDERIALLLNGQKTVLKLMAFDEDCTNCSDLYRFEFVQRFGTEHGYFAELNMAHTTDHPCCDGGNTERGTRFLLIAVPSGAVALRFDKEIESISPDDENGDAQSECKSAITYERDGDDLRGVSAKTTCMENGKFKAPVTTRRYQWDRAKERFVGSATRSSSHLPK